MINITKQLLSEWFKWANEEVFNNEIKREPKYVITTNKSRFGQFRPSSWTIEISTAYIRSENAYKNTFLHELCHLYVRQKYGAFVQPHGYEWKKVAERVTTITNGKYGIIKRVNGANEEIIYRNPKGVNNYVVFTDYQGELSISKYANSSYVCDLKDNGVIKDNTPIYYIKANSSELAHLPMHRKGAAKVHWNRSIWSLDDLRGMANSVCIEQYNKYGRVG